MNEIDIHKETTEEIAARMINKFEELGGESLGLADERRWLLQSIAYGLFVRNQTTNEGLKMNFVRYTKGLYADEIGMFTDTERLSAKAATDTFRFEIDEAQPSVIGVPPTRITPGNSLYFITEYFEFSPGETIKEVIGTCMEVGAVGNNFLPGEINKIVDPFPFFKSVINLDGSQGGAEIESDSSLKERIREAPSKFSTAGPEDGYKYWAKTANQDIIDVDVARTVPGTVRITPLMVGGELPSESILEAVNLICSDKKRRPLTDNVIVDEPTQIPYNIDFTYYISNSNIGLVKEIQAKVQKAVTDFIAWQKGALKRDINPTELSYLVRSAGAKRVEIVKPTFQKVEVFQVAKEASVNLKFGGVEDD